MNDLVAGFGVDTKPPLSTDVAGYYLMSLIISIPFYWFMLFLVETRIISTALNKCCG